MILLLLLTNKPMATTRCAFATVQPESSMVMDSDALSATATCSSLTDSSNLDMDIFFLVSLPSVISLSRFAAALIESRRFDR